MHYLKAFKNIIAIVVILLVAYFFYSQFKNNWHHLMDYRFFIDWTLILPAFLLLLISMLIETKIWMYGINLNIHKTTKLTFGESIAILNTSNLLKYIPGKIWSYTAQVFFISKYNLSKSATIYINILCLISSIIISFSFGIISFLLNSTIISPIIFALSIIAILVLDALFIFYHKYLLSTALKIINCVLKIKIKNIYIPYNFLIISQLAYISVWLLVGLSGLFIGSITGIIISINNYFVIVAAMSISWLIGFLSLLTPGGLGIREGLMSLMLQSISIELSLILPIASRIIYLILELFLGIIAIFLGYYYKIFQLNKK